MPLEILASGASLSSQSLQYLLQQQRAADAIRKQSRVQTNFQLESRPDSLSRAKLGAVQPDTQAAIAYLKDVVSRIDAIRTNVWKMLSLETNARTGDANSIAGYAGDFDAVIRSLNGIANQNVAPPNLLGSVFANDLSYIKDIVGNRSSISHVDLSSGYYIVDSGGNTWKKNNSATDGTLVQYNALGAATGKSVEVTRQLRLDSLNAGTIGFTILPGTASEESFTGATLFTNGLNILDSWAYDGLATASGRSRAESSLKSAMAVIDVQSAAFKGALARAEFDLGLTQVAADGATGKISSLDQRKLLDLKEIEDAATRESRAAAAAATGNLIRLRAYRKMFDASRIGNLFNIFA